MPPPRRQEKNILRPAVNLSDVIFRLFHVMKVKALCKAGGFPSVSGYCFRQCPPLYAAIKKISCRRGLGSRRRLKLSRGLLSGTARADPGKDCASATMRKAWRERFSSNNRDAQSQVSNLKFHSPVSERKGIPASSS